MSKFESLPLYSKAKLKNGKFVQIIDIDKSNGLVKYMVEHIDRSTQDGNTFWIRPNAILRVN